ncbi:MAG TPA: hypothetical protein VNH12_11795 [Burkholderiales bacterium]|nr:hypothetical protein [Burkholderiales bacterium]
MADSPKEPFEVRQHILERAGRLMGHSRLAAGLKVSEDELENWIDGRKPIPSTMLGPLAELLARFAEEKRR